MVTLRMRVKGKQIEIIGSPQEVYEASLKLLEHDKKPILSLRQENVEQKREEDKQKIRDFLDSGAKPKRIKDLLEGAGLNYAYSRNLKLAREVLEERGIKHQIAGRNSKLIYPTEAVKVKWEGKTKLGELKVEAETVEEVKRTIEDIKKTEEELKQSKLEKEGKELEEKKEPKLEAECKCGCGEMTYGGDYCHGHELPSEVILRHGSYHYESVTGSRTPVQIRKKDVDKVKRVIAELPNEFTKRDINQKFHEMYPNFNRRIPRAVKLSLVVLWYLNHIAIRGRGTRTYYIKTEKFKDAEKLPNFPKSKKEGDEVHCIKTGSPVNYNTYCKGCPSRVAHDDNYVYCDI